jgi:tRNA pseudouridine55 synthase
VGLKNKRPDLNGVLVADKPLGWTSAQVCGLVRRRTRGAKVGHAGTLDPLATGVLVLCLGGATKMIPSLMAGRKRYLAEIDLAHTSPTDDLEGGRQAVEGAEAPTEEAVRRACASLVGTISQRPPVHAAVWVDGERSYNLARRGEAVELKVRPVEVYSIDPVEYAWPRLVLDVACGKGTYIRSLARDLGGSLGVGGMLTGLRRTEVGPFGLGDAVVLDPFPEEAALRESLERLTGRSLGE